jgi:hypothetical protein
MSTNWTRVTDQSLSPAIPLRVVSTPICLAPVSLAFLEKSSEGRHLLDSLFTPCIMSQFTYGERDIRSTMSYDERETALFRSSSSGSEYDTEDALSQPTTDDDCVGHVEGATVPSRDRAQSLPFVTAVLTAMLRGVRGAFP